MTDQTEMQDRMEQALQRWRARGTPGPWEEKWDGEGGAFVIGNRQVVANMMGADDHKANAALVAAAPYMAARIEALEAERDRLREALRPFVEYVHDDLRRGNAAYVLMPCSTSGGGWIGAEDLRRARAALKGEGE